MKTEMIKFNSDRSVFYQIETKIIEENGKKIVSKSALTEEAKNHIFNIYNNYEILKNAYDVCKICPVRFNGDSVEFDYIDGEALITKYKKAIDANDKTQYLNLLKMQVELIKGDHSNECVFHVTPEFEEIFGDGSAYESQTALKVVNFEATPQNIIFEKETGGPVFIDYEWVFQFPMPLDLVLYHCIVVVGSFYLTGLENFILRKDLMSVLNIQTDEMILEKTWQNFFKTIDKAETGSLSKTKAEQYLKKNIDIGRLSEENANLRGVHQYNKRLQIDIKEQQACIEELNQGLYKQNEYVMALENDIKNQQNHIEILEEGLKSQQGYIETLKTDIENQQNYTAILEKGTKDQQIYIETLETDMRNQQNYIVILENKFNDQQQCIESYEEKYEKLKNVKITLEKEQRQNENKLKELQILTGRQQDRILKQAQIINVIKDSFAGRVLFGRLF